MTVSHRSASSLAALAAGLLQLAGCDSARPGSEQQAVRPTVLELSQRGADRVEIAIAGPEGLRAIQLGLRYDAGAVQVAAVEPGPQAARLDRLFHSDLTKTAGALVLGLSDTRRVRLPGRGVLLSLVLAKASPGARLTIVDALGVREVAGGTPEALVLGETSLELDR